MAVWAILRLLRDVCGKVLLSTFFLTIKEACDKLSPLKELLELTISLFSKVLVACFWSRPFI